MSANNIFDIRVMDRFTGKGVGSAGGVVQVCVNGTAHKAALTDPANNFAALANPVSIANGRIYFAVSTGGPGQASPGLVDIYGITNDGHPIALTGIKPGDPTEVYIDQNEHDTVLIVPFAVADCTPGTEKDTGFVIPSGSIVYPNPSVVVSTAAGQGSKTVSMGLLSSQSGGNATGFVNGISLTSIAKLKTTINGASATIGALLTTTQGGGAQTVAECALIGATAVNVSYTITSAATLAEGFIMLPLQLNNLPNSNP